MPGPAPGGRREPPAARGARDAAVIDLHSHILPGLDDGPRTMEQSLELAAAAVDDGIRVLAATPHVRDDYPTSATTMERGVGEVRAALAGAGIDLDLRPGGEIDLGWLERLGASELARFGLGGSPAYLLVEFPYVGWPVALVPSVVRLLQLGITPVIAHPERSAEVRAEPERLRAVVASGALTQLTAASLDGRLGSPVRAAALDLIDRGLAHLIASDAHTPGIRAVGMRSAADAVQDEGLANWLVEDVPAAIVAGFPLPPRPERQRRTWSLRGLLGPSRR